jgi:phosphoadenosine phosphosulfate reductase
MAARPRQPDIFAGDEEAAAVAASLDARYGNASAQEVIAFSAREGFPGALAAVSSFGADSAVLLHMLAEVDPALPVIFLDTGKHFEETISYRDALAADLGLTNIEIVTPDEAALARIDPAGLLHATDTDACCDVRKVEPMARGVAPYRAWFTGRKRHQASTRQVLPVFESVGPRVRINPLAHFTTADQADYMRRHGLRENPLVAYGYLSIGCFPCTSIVKAGEDARSGRWAGQAKTECGIHLGGLDASLQAASGQNRQKA